MLKKLTYFVFIMFFFIEHAFAKELIISNDQNKINLVPSIEYNIDANGTIDAPPIEGWSELPHSQVKFGFDDRTHWFRVNLINASEFAASYYLEIDNPLLDNLTLYILKDGRVRTVQNLGDNQNFTLRPVKHESFVVPIGFAPQEELELYLAIKTYGFVDVPIYLWQKEVFQEQQNYSRLVNGVFYGVILSIIVIGIIIFSFTKDFTPLLESAFLLSLLMITATLSGLAFHYLWPNIPDLQNHAVYIFACLAILFSALVARQNLKHFYFDHRLIRSFEIIALLSVIFIPATLYLSYQYGLYFIVSISIAICLAHLYAGKVAWTHGLHEHQELNYGLMTLLIALLLISLNNLALLSLPISNQQILQLSLIAQALFMIFSTVRSYATSYNTFGDVEEDEKDKDLQLSEQMMELQFALRELQEKNEQLEKLSTIDDLSGIHNRRHFDQRLLAELRRGRRELSTLSLIIFDIDHFKKVNDNYGHIAGDEVIRSVSLVSSQQLHRPSDEIFRYGGEEFAVLLPNTDSEGAMQLAEIIRQAIENISVTVNDQTLTCTVSLGVATHLSEQAIKPSEFIEFADKALYQAKQNGRNQVIKFQP